MAPEEVMKQFGVDLSGAVNAGTSFTIGNLTNVFATAGQAIAPGGLSSSSGSGAAATFKSSRGSVTAIVQAMIRRLFPGVPQGSAASGYITLNLVANMLGMGNAATPFAKRDGAKPPRKPR